MSHSRYTLLINSWLINSSLIHWLKIRHNFREYLDRAHPAFLTTLVILVLILLIICSTTNFLILWLCNNFDNTYDKISLYHLISTSRYQSAMESMRIGLIWIDCECQAWARITPEFGWGARKTLNNFPSNSCLRRVIGGLIWRRPSTNTSGQVWRGKASNSATWLNRKWLNKFSSFSYLFSHYQYG